MRRWPTWLLVGGLVALGSVAAADALRGDGVEIRSRQSARPPATTTAVLRLREPRGILYYSDAEDECRLHGVGLPRLENAPPPKLRSCEFSLSPDAFEVLPGDWAWSRGGLYARESGGVIELGAVDSAERLRFPGRAPAFRPDGTLTYLDGNAVVEWVGDCPPRTRLFGVPPEEILARCRGRVLGERDLRRMLEIGRDERIAVTDLAWFDDRRLGVVVDVEPSNSEAVLIVEGRDFHVGALFPGFGRTIETSPAGGYYTTWFGPTLVAIDTRHGISVGSRFIGSRARLAWSPDDRWTAVATHDSVFIARTNEADGRIQRLPVVARDLAWR